jgi:hypothetical protein
MSISVPHDVLRDALLRAGPGFGLAFLLGDLFVQGRLRSRYLSTLDRIGLGSAALLFLGSSTALPFLGGCAALHIIGKFARRLFICEFLGPPPDTRTAHQRGNHRHAADPHPRSAACAGMVPQRS